MIFKNLGGTSEDEFQIGRSGPVLKKNTSNLLEVRDDVGALSQLTAYPVLGLARSTVSFNTTITSTSTTAVVMGTSPNHLSLTPGGGTYLVIFSCDYKARSNAQYLTFSIFANNVEIIGSKRYLRPASTSPQLAMSTDAIVTIADTQTIEGRWMMSGSTGTSYNRKLTAIRLA